MPHWYPVMLRLDGRDCLVAGGGEVAERKTEGLLQAGASVTVVSPSATRRLSEWAAEGRVRWLAREAAGADVEGAALVFAATDNPSANRMIADAARALGIPVNVADDGEAGDFLVPATVRRGDLILTASASGAGPAFASRIAGELAEAYGPDYEDLVKTLKEIRLLVKAEVPDASERRALLRAAAGDEAIAMWRSREGMADKPRMLEALRRIANRRGSATETNG
ncbi:bifunctional precorrin-2 dehydrogenase/sirohydrochlorin ferrochelatase [Cohnella suwonensis]|uniref:precorrin-2 dehydrogenase n=1 Tax=Cohnella suwonensis TaxID=696072 RepID=A0ABW0LR11_9BACL